MGGLEREVHSLRRSYDKIMQEKKTAVSKLANLQDNNGLPLTYAAIYKAPVTFTVKIKDTTPGAQRCTSMAALQNMTGTNGIDVALFSDDNNCCECALGPRVYRGIGVTGTALPSKGLPLLPLPEGPPP